MRSRNEHWKKQKWKVYGRILNLNTSIDILYQQMRNNYGLFTPIVLKIKSVKKKIFWFKDSLIELESNICQKLTLPKQCLMVPVTGPKLA